MRGLRSPHLWVSSTYFAEGFPYSLVNNVAEVMFEQLGASLQAIGLTSLFHLPWNLKFLWGPFVDHYETKRRWLLGIELAICVALLVIAFTVGAGVLSWTISVGFLVLAFLSATHDIAIDGYYLEALDEDGQSKFVGYRAMAFRVATLVLGGPLLWLISKTNWFVGLLAATAMMGLVTLLHFVALPPVETRKRGVTTLLARAIRLPVFLTVAVVAMLIALERRFHVVLPGVRAGWAVVESHPVLGKIGIEGFIVMGLLLATVWGSVAVRLWQGRARSGARAGSSQSEYARSFASFFAQPHIGLVLAFVIFFRTGESFLMKMRWPFLHKVMGLELGYYGIVNGTVGVAASFTATMVGGWLIGRYGLRRFIWPFVLAQNGLNLLYLGLALLPNAESVPRAVVASVIAAEHVGAGLGTAVFMVYMMRACDPEHKAGHFAILSALMSISFTVAGVTSGFLAARIGFANYFAFTFLATFPAMVLIFFVPHLDGREDGKASARSRTPLP